jgi:hypothetical protein
VASQYALLWEPILNSVEVTSWEGHLVIKENLYLRLTKF